jgi:hypothetical protein
MRLQVEIPRQVRAVEFPEPKIHPMPINLVGQPVGEVACCTRWDVWQGDHWKCTRRRKHGENLDGYIRDTEGVSQRVGGGCKEKRMDDEISVFASKRSCPDYRAGNREDVIYK